MPTNLQPKRPNRSTQYPKYGEAGRKTIGNRWTTLLNAFGNPIEHYGNLDLNLKKKGGEQTGALSELIA